MNFVDFEKESIVENFDCYQLAAKEAQQKYQEILPYTNKLNLRAANIISQSSMVKAIK